MTEWMHERETWVRGLSDADLMRVVDLVNERSALDENEGDRTERRMAIKWLLSRGERGEDFGIPPGAAEELGLWPSPHPEADR